MITEQSNVKINFGLSILDKRLDGYHNLDTIFAELEFGDTITFAPAEEYKLTAEIKSSTDLSLGNDNLISQAYRLIRSMSENTLTEFTIHLKKQIPMGAGLGGGSSNAAATLRGLNKLWNVGLSDTALELLGLKIGADVPFFIRGNIQRGEGVGEKLSPIQYAERWWVVVSVPPTYCSTTEAYRNFKKHLSVDYQRSKFSGSVLTEKSLIPLFNDFEPMIFDRYPEVEKTKSQMIENGALYASLSGSGSAVFGVFQDLKDAKVLLTNLDSSSFSFLTKIKYYFFGKDFS